LKEVKEDVESVCGLTFVIFVTYRNGLDDFVFDDLP